MGSVKNHNSPSLKMEARQAGQRLEKRPGNKRERGDCGLRGAQDELGSLALDTKVSQA